MLVESERGELDLSNAKSPHPYPKFDLIQNTHFNKQR